MPISKNVDLREALNTRLLFVTLLGVSACLVTGCGAADSSPSQAASTPTTAARQQVPPQASFASRVNEVCSSINSRVTSLPREISPAATEFDLRTEMVLAPAWSAELEAIRPPTWAKDRYDALLVINAQQSKLIGTVLADARAGQVSAVQAIQHQLAVDGTRYNHLATSLGLSACAANPVPSGSA